MINHPANIRKWTASVNGVNSPCTRADFSRLGHGCENSRRTPGFRRPDSRLADAIEAQGRRRGLDVVELKGSGTDVVGHAQGGPLQKIGGTPHRVSESDLTVERELIPSIADGLETVDARAQPARSV